MGMLFAGSKLPIEDFTPAIFPEAQSNQDHDLFAAALLSVALSFVLLDLLCLALDRDPDAIELNHLGRGGKGAHTHLLDERFYLVDPFIDGSQSHIPSDLFAPALTNHAQTLPQPTTKECILIEIEPKPTIFLQNTKSTDHIVMAVLTLQHWDSQTLNMPPARLQASF